MSRIYDLEERLIAFAIRMMTVAENLPQTKSGIHLSGQLIRSGTSPALNYGEAQAAESKRDFIHKMKIVLKELRETRICLLIINNKPVGDITEIEKDINECNELIAIFAKSVKTVESKIGKK